MDMFSIMSTLFPIMFVLICGIILFNLFGSLKQWNYNNQQPILTVHSRIVTKRTAISRHNHNHNHNHNGHVHHSTSTSYFATFEVESGDRMELSMSGNDFGQIAEGDIGKLTFQGTRFKGFERVGIVQSKKNPL